MHILGGGIADGHPICAIGAVLTTHLLHSVKRDLVTLCIGGDQGIALALDAI